MVSRYSCRRMETKSIQIAIRLISLIQRDIPYKNDDGAFDGIFMEKHAGTLLI